MVRATPLPAEERRAAIIQATEPLLARHGTSISTRQIAEAAGVAEGTIFRVFPNKETLICEVIEHITDERHAVQAFAAINPDLDLEQRLCIVAEVLQARLREVMAVFHAVGWGPKHEGAPEDWRRRQEESHRILSRAIVTVIEPDQDQLRLPAAEVANLLRALVFSATHPRLSEGIQTEPKAIVQLLLHGACRPPIEPIDPATSSKDA
ncbi:TetR/AcrR family transcriptional regulator [Microlunatus panaciterrae]|uniref:AcrR family transcriptional regulator n=1 Tax=Microlunatus panaciterrae TaxID=400768 RepID=A0ABS2RIG8_9ACTN|nr:TetR/AcrR family transcriptional regulator [Microlunatus panaciterrae]MBM7798791.1 AcrR family transcriptional regulator [Microlunatus panaciterrae]